MSYRVRKSERVFSGKVFNVRTEEVENPEGGLMRVDLVEHAGAVVLAPVDARGRILFVDQYRHPAGGRLLELPAGTLEAQEPPEVCAERECREETGMAPGTLTYLGGFYIAPGYSTEFLHCYLAEDLTRSPLSPDKDEDLRVLPLTVEEVQARLQSGEIQDAKTLACWLLLTRHTGFEA